ncbi:MAG TPA: hypothetical protein VK909_07990, partial [Anaerolineales bacterium]|nr:hypothetical protein [Anaerolineales bacterium]
PPPEFTPRYKITNLFSEFAEDFTRKARDSGVELRWIGVGTWKTPVELVPEKHLEAWKISQENLKKSSEETLKKSENEAMLDKMESLIRSVPLEAYEEIAGTTRQFRRHSRRDFVRKEPDNSTDLTVIEPGTSGDSAEDLMSSLILFQALQGRGSSSSNYYDLDHESAMKLLLMEYRKQLIEAVEFMRSRNETVPPKIEEAIRLIDEQSGWQHWVGRAR